MTLTLLSPRATKVTACMHSCDYKHESYHPSYFPSRYWGLCSDTCAQFRNIVIEPQKFINKRVYLKCLCSGSYVRRSLREFRFSPQSNISTRIHGGGVTNFSWAPQKWQKYKDETSKSQFYAYLRCATRIKIWYITRRFLVRIYRKNCSLETRCADPE